MLTVHDRQLQQLGRQVQRDWERALRTRAGRAAQYRRLALIAAGVSVTSVALAATAITKGYIDHPPSYWEARIAEHPQSPIYDHDHTLIGSVGNVAGQLSDDAPRGIEAGKPLKLMPAGATGIACAQVYPRESNPDYDAELARANRARAVQCQVLQRALLRAPDVLSTDASAEHDFAATMQATLEHLQGTPGMRKMLCMPLVPGKEESHAQQYCGIEARQSYSANVLALKVDAGSGAIRAMYASTPHLLDSTLSIGSTAKWAVILAALAQGSTPGQMLCPQAASNGGNPLHRVTEPRVGYADCSGGQHLVSLERATAESDNLVFYALAKTLGEARLRAALNALDLGEPDNEDNLAFALSFGTYGAQPRELIAAAQALVSVAYDIRTTGAAPRALAHVAAQSNPLVAEIKKLLPRAEQREALRRLLEAPVTQKGGTLSAYRNTITAGKTGTVQSSSYTAQGRRFMHSKWSITFQREKNALNLFMIASPWPSVPLARPDMRHRALLPAHLVVLNLE
jgi:hypothetical protein